MTTRADVIACARTWVGVRWRHQGRDRAHGVDCAGLVAVVAHDLALSEADDTAYPRLPTGQSLVLRLRAHMEEVPVGAARPGDVLVLRDPVGGPDPAHVAILADDAAGRPTVIHAAARLRRVVEQPLTEDLGRLRTHAFRLPGLED